VTSPARGRDDVIELGPRLRLVDQDAG